MTQFIVEKKQDYLLKLEQSTSALFYQGFKAIYSFTVEQNKIHKNLLKEFQANLKEISTWAEEDIETEYARFKNIDKLILSLFKINLAILNPHKTDFKYPSPAEYIYQCNLNIARNIWKNPFLFYEKNLSKSEIQQNYNKILKMIKKSINETFVQMIPADEEEDKEDVGNKESNDKDEEEDSDDSDEDEEDDDEEDDDEEDDDEEDDDEEDDDEEDEEDEDEDEDDDEEDDDEEDEEDEDDDEEDEEDEDEDEDSDDEEEDDEDDEEEDDEDSDEEDDEDEEDDDKEENEEDSGDDEEESSEDEPEPKPEPEPATKVITLLDKKNLIKEKLKNNVGKKYDSFF